MLAAVGLVVGDDHSEMASGLIDLVADESLDSALSARTRHSMASDAIAVRSGGDGGRVGSGRMHVAAAPGSFGARDDGAVIHYGADAHNPDGDVVPV